MRITEASLRGGGRERSIDGRHALGLARPDARPIGVIVGSYRVLGGKG